MAELQSSEVTNLPEGWARTLLGELITLAYEKFKPTNDSAEIFIGLEHVESKTGKIIGHGTSTDVRSTKTKFHKGDILYGRLRPYLNKICVPSFDGICSTDILVFVKTDLIVNEYIARYLSTTEFVRYATQNMSGVQHPRISYDSIAKYEISLPPFLEQHRIASKLEEVFTKLDAGVAALKKIKVQLKRYRQSILKCAFEGKLTEQWRRSHKGEIVSSFILLEKIKKNRTSRKIMDEEARTPTSTFLTIPNEWVWTRINVVTDEMQYGSSEKASNESTGIPVLRMGNIQDGKIIFVGLKYYPANWSSLNEFLLGDGDILFNRTNSAELVGKSAVYKSEYPKAVFVRVNKEFYNPNMLSFFINSFHGHEYISSVVSQQVGQANVNGRKLSMMPIPLPPLMEQNKIVEEIEYHFSIVDSVEAIVKQSLKHTEVLRQTILKTALEGRLIQQDPTDEPATILLKRIREEKAKHEFVENKMAKRLTKIDNQQKRLA